MSGVVLKYRGLCSNVGGCAQKSGVVLKYRGLCSNVGGCAQMSGVVLECRGSCSNIGDLLKCWGSCSDVGGLLCGDYISHCVVMISLRDILLTGVEPEPHAPSDEELRLKKDSERADHAVQRAV